MLTRTLRPVLMHTINKTGTVGIFVVMELTSVLHALDKKMFLVPFTGKSSLKGSFLETSVYKLASGP